MPLGLIAATSATAAAIHQKQPGSGITRLITSNEEMNDIMKTVKFYKESSLLIKSIRETIKNETKEQNGGFLGMLLDTLGGSLSGNFLAGKDTIRGGKGRIRAGQDFNVASSRSIIRTNLNFMVFPQEIIYLKYRMGHM